MAILTPLVFGVRNVVTSGLLERLRRSGVDCRLLLRRLPRAAEEGSEGVRAVRGADGIDALLAPPGESPRGAALLGRIRACAFARARGLHSYDLYRRWFNRHEPLGRRARAGVIELIGGAVARTPAEGWLSRRLERLYRESHDLSAVRSQLAELAPDAVWSTACISVHELPYVYAARDLGIPVVTSIMSFDNLTSRSELPRFDAYWVWSERMRDQLLALYPDVPPGAVTVTGTPQFDFHQVDAYRWERSVLLDRLGVPPGRRYFLYAASHVNLTPQEPELVAAIRRQMDADPKLRESWLVLRLHPLDDGTRWGSLFSGAERVALSRAWDLPNDSDGWTFPSRVDMGRLISTLLHAEACLNVASTMSLDAAQLDRPVIGLDLRGEPSAPPQNLYGEYAADHYRPLVASGGLRVAVSWRELREAMVEAAEHPERRRAERARMIEEECGVPDGRSAERVAQALQSFLSARERRADARSA